jgi:hypothetical protein
MKEIDFFYSRGEERRFFEVVELRKEAEGGGGRL